MLPLVAFVALCRGACSRPRRARAGGHAAQAGAHGDARGRSAGSGPRALPGGAGAAVVRSRPAVSVRVRPSGPLPRAPARRRRPRPAGGAVTGSSRCGRSSSAAAAAAPRAAVRPALGAVLGSAADALPCAAASPERSARRAPRPRAGLSLRAPSAPGASAPGAATRAPPRRAPPHRPRPRRPPARARVARRRPRPLRLGPRPHGARGRLAVGRGARRLAAGSPPATSAVRAAGGSRWLALPEDAAAAAARAGRALRWLDAPLVTALAGAAPGRARGARRRARPRRGRGRRGRRRRSAGAAALRRWPPAGIDAAGAAARSAPRRPRAARARGGRSPPRLDAAVAAPAGAAWPRDAPPRGQASVLLVGGARRRARRRARARRGRARRGARGRGQRAADLAALAGARAMHDAYPRLFEPATLDGRPNPRHLDRDAYLALGRDAAAARPRGANGAEGATVALPGRRLVRAGADPRGGPRAVEVSAASERRRASVAARRGRARAAGGGGLPESPPAAATTARWPTARASRCGRTSRWRSTAWSAPRAPTASRCVITSAYRSDAEQAVLLRRHPDPKWVAPPGTSLHRYGTELDLGPPAAYAWLAANAERFHFIQRYSWEPWHYGYTLNPRSRLRRTGGGEATARAVARAGVRARAASRRCSRARRSAGTSRRRCSPRSCTPRATSTRSPSSRGRRAGDRAVHAGHGARDRARRPVRRRAGDRRPGAPDARPAAPVRRRCRSRSPPTTPGPGAVAGCGCVPPYPETRGVRRADPRPLGGAGEPVADGRAGLKVRLVR